MGTIFDRYPKEGHYLCLRLRGENNCRHGYGLNLIKRTGITTCAYCGVSLVDDYYHWLLMAVDHVVPAQEARRLGVPAEFSEDLINKVLCCSGCNGFGNRYHVSKEPQETWTLEEFVKLRDEIFAERSASIAERRRVENSFFEERYKAPR